MPCWQNDQNIFTILQWPSRQDTMSHFLTKIQALFAGAALIALSIFAIEYSLIAV